MKDLALWKRKYGVRAMVKD